MSKTRRALDFLRTKPWAAQLVELILVSLDETSTVRRLRTAARYEVVPGIHSEFYHLSPDAENELETPRAELLHIGERIEDKVWNKKRNEPSKFPEPQPGRQHLLLVKYGWLRGHGGSASSSVASSSVDSSAVKSPRSARERRVRNEAGTSSNRFTRLDQVGLGRSHHDDRGRRARSRTAPAGNHASRGSTAEARTTTPERSPDGGRSGACGYLRGSRPTHRYPTSGRGVASWKDRLARLKRYAFPTFGTVPLPDIRPGHVREAVTLAFEAGKSKGTTRKLLVDCSTILGELWRDEVMAENPAARVRVPKGAPVNDRERVVLTDAEFEAFMACHDVGVELHTMALTSRTFGGMRTSDLHAWDWGHIHAINWVDAHVPRPKTKSKDRLGLPAVLVPVLQAWWHAHGKPTLRPVFPVRKGKRAGERKKGKISYAKRLREALWQAGIVRPLPGFHDATAEAQQRRLCLIQAGSEHYLPIDFHSFQRAYNRGSLERV